MISDGYSGKGIRKIIVTLFIPFYFYANPLLPEEKNKIEPAVIRLDENEMIVESEEKAVFKKHRVIQINNQKGNEYGEIYLCEDKFTEIDNIHAVIRDTSGKTLKKLSKNDIKETTLSPGHILYADLKTTYFKLDYPTYPYLIEYDYKLEFSTLLYWPDWYPQSDIPVLKSLYKLVLEKPVKFKYYPIGIDGSFEKKIDKGQSVFIWELDSIPAKIDEDFMPVKDNIQKTILFAPVEFKLAEYSGSTESWNSFARWYHDLSTNRYNLPPQAVVQVDSIVALCHSRNEIIEKLYSFLQNKTRYVEISLGIGGYQPHIAASVFNNCYGDCKDLTTFMIALLKQVGIEAYPALMLTRDKGEVISDFPCNQFNHVLACIPCDSDTTWLETTADHLAAGELSWSQEGCDVLLVKEDQGLLVKTPQSNSNDNKWVGRIQGSLMPGGILDFSAQINLSGNQKHEFISKWMYTKPAEFKEWFNKFIGRYTMNPDLSDLQLAQDVINNCKIAELSFTGKFHNVGIYSASRLFINPNLLNQRTAVFLSDNKPRKFPLEFIYPYVDQDSVSISLPYGYELESGPKPCDLQTTFAAYSTGYSIHNNIFYYTRRFELKKKTIPAEWYNEYVDFIRKVTLNDQTKFVFKK
jgi:transglutaminase-like putative cysteine protease